MLRCDMASFIGSMHALFRSEVQRIVAQSDDCFGAISEAPIDRQSVGSGRAQFAAEENHTRTLERFQEADIRPR